LPFVKREKKYDKIREMAAKKAAKEKIKELPPPAKHATVQAYTELGFSVRRIAKIMGIDKDTVSRYRKKELDDEWGQFKDTIKKIYLEQDFELARLAYEEIRKKIGRARFYELVGLYKTVRELQQPATPTIAQQFNIQPILGGASRNAENDSSQQNNPNRKNS